MKRHQLATVGMLLLTLTACNKAATTSFSQSYRNPGYEETVFKRILVIAVSEDEEGRKSFEDALASALAGQGATAAPSYTVVPHSDQVSEEELHGLIESSGIDGVLLTRLVSVDKDSEYVPPKKYNNPQTRYYPGGLGMGYGYGGYYGFYGTTYAAVHTPGYFDTNTTLTLESNLYSVATNELVWTGQSETIDPDSIEDARESVTAAVAQKLKAERLIP